MTIKDLNPNADASIENVNINITINGDTATLESTDRMALMIATCTAISNGNCEFVSGTDTSATLRKIA